ncbi:MAG: sulfotransferase [bacterium]
MTNWFEHPVALGSFRSWIRLVRTAETIDPELWPRVAAVGLTTLATSPLRFAERLRFGASVAASTPHPEPLFVLGHWRTGTTHLLNLLAQDEQFGCVSTFQAMVPGFCLIAARHGKPWLERTLARSHPTREIDNMPLALDAPQEEAFALANVTPGASLHVFTLPRQGLSIFARYGLLEGLAPRERREWIDAYLGVLRKATYAARGRRLVLKDPSNTGRISTLLELFPRARFVHIVRDPHRVLPSTLGIYRVVLAKAALQRVSEAEIEELVLAIYDRLMRKYLAERASIPPGQLTEVRYEELEARPLEELARVYGELGLAGFEAALPRFRAYLDGIGEFRKNEYRVDAAVAEQVSRRWGFALEEWNYPRLAAVP